MLHKVGDEVVIRDDFVLNDGVSTDRYYYNLTMRSDGMLVQSGDGDIVNDEMAVFSGRIAVITDDRDGRYKIDLDESEWSWYDEMFTDESNYPETIKMMDFDDRENMILFLCGEG